MLTASLVTNYCHGRLQMHINYLLSCGALPAEAKTKLRTSNISKAGLEGVDDVDARARASAGSENCASFKV